MALAVKVKITGGNELRAVLNRMSPRLNPKIISNAFVKGMLRVLRNAQLQQIERGGDHPPLPDRLTSRTGTLRRSLGPSFGLDRSNLPRSISGGTSLIYGRVHELGLGRFPQRAFLAPALEAERLNIERDIRQEWERAIR